MNLDVKECMTIQRNPFRKMIKLEVQEIYIGFVKPSHACTWVN